MKLLLLPALVGLAFLTGASGPGPLRDEIPTLLTARSEMARLRAELADLRQGRGMSAPEWVRGYARALCASDAKYIVDHTDATLAVTEDEMKAQFERMHENELDCTGYRYLGSLGDHQFIFVLHHGTRDTWYLFTLSADGRSIAKVE